MQILTATIHLSGDKYILTVPDGKGQEQIKVGEGTLTSYQKDKELFQNGDIVAFKPGKTPYLIGPASALGVVMGTVKTVEYTTTASGAAIVNVSLDKDGGFARIKFSGKLPVSVGGRTGSGSSTQGGDILEGGTIEAVGTVSAYVPEGKDVAYTSIWASSVNVLELGDF
jgi:hypothetical protein